MIAHQKDYRSLYDRMKINLGNVKEAPVMTTDKLLKGMDERTNLQADNLYLEMLYYQSGVTCSSPVRVKVHCLPTCKGFGLTDSKMHGIQIIILTSMYR